MSEKQPVYNTRIKSGEYIPVTPPRNPEFYIVTEKQAENAFRKWRDITKTTNAEMFEAKREWNQLILKAVYGGSGDGRRTLSSSGFTKAYGEELGIEEGGIPIRDKDIRLIPGTKEYFEYTDWYNGQPKKRREEMLLKQKKKEEKQDIGEEVTEEENIKPQISKVVKEKIIDDDGTDLSEDVLGESLNEIDISDGETPAIVGDVTGGGAPKKVDKPNKSKVPPIIISHNEGGDFIMGAEDEDVTRKRDIGVYSSKADNRLRLYRDGGFELHSSRDENSENLKMGSAIVQDCINAPLHIISNGDIHVSCAGTFSVDASRIVLKSNAVNETGINIDAEADVRIQAGRDYLVTADNITIDAKERIVSHSEGWQILIGQYIRLHEPQTKICPAFLTEYIEGQIKTLKT